MLVSIDTNFLYFKAPKNVAKKLRSHYVGSKKVWRIPNTMGAIKEYLSFYENHQLEEYLETKRVSYQNHIAIKLQDDVEGNPKLRPYQRVDVAFLNKLEHAGIFNEQRTGKTPTVLSLNHVINANRLLIVAPAVALYNLKAEVKQWLGRDSMILDGKVSTKLKKDLLPMIQTEAEIVVITSFQTLAQNVDYFHNHWDAMIIDEAHYIRNSETQRALACFKVGKKALHRYAMTGTVTVKNARDLFSVLKFLYPERFLGKWEFMERYMKLEYDWFTKEYRPGNSIDPDKEIEIQEIISVLGVNRKRAEVMKWLPEKQYITIPIALSKDQLKVYKSVEQWFSYVDEKKGININCVGVLDQLTRLNQISLTLDIFREKNKYDSSKTEWIQGWLEENEGDSVLIFSKSKKYLNMLFEQLKGDYDDKVAIITGDTANHKRQEIADNFQAGKITILVANIQALGVALTLDRAEVCIFADRWFTPAVNEQAEDRIVPVSEKRNHPITIYSLCAIGTYDETIEKLLRHRKDITEILNSGGLQALKRELERIESTKNIEYRAYHA